MPAIDNIVVADATPTNHTFAPQQASIALSTWMEDSAATYEGNARVAMTMSPPSKARATTREKITLALPFEREVNGLVTVPDVMLFNLDVVVPSALSAAEALKGYTMFKNLMANATVQALIADRQPCW